MALATTVLPPHGHLLVGRPASLLHVSTPEPPSGEPPERPPPTSSTASQPPAQPPPTTALTASAAVAVPNPSGPPSPPYPASLEITYPSELNRWLPLVKWLLAVPHYIALFFVGIGAFFVLVYGFFAVLFTGRWPRGAFDYLVGTIRWFYRVIAYVHLMTDAYPPFSLADDPGYPLRLHIDYPEHIDNWRPLVQWLLAIPYLMRRRRALLADRGADGRRLLHGALHQADPPGSVRADAARPALEPSRQRLRLLHDRPLSPVRLGIAAKGARKRSLPSANRS